MEGQKKCSICGEIKLLGHFHRNLKMKDGYLNQCILCRKEKHGENMRECRERQHDIARHGGLRKKIFERDRYECCYCGMTQEEHLSKWGRGLTIHHIDGTGRYTWPEERNHAEENMVTLCLSCHGKEDSKMKGKKKSLKGILK